MRGIVSANACNCNVGVERHRSAHNDWPSIPVIAVHSRRAAARCGS